MALGDLPSRRQFLTATGALAAGAVAAAALPSRTAHAEETRTALNQAPTSPDGIWTDELRELDRASDAASDYAENNYGVGILIHVGKDIPNDVFKSGEALGKVFVQRFKEHGVNAKVFTRQNDKRSTVMEYRLGHQTYGAEEKSGGVMGLQTAWDSVPDAAKQLPIVKQLVTSRLENER